MAHLRFKAVEIAQNRESNSYKFNDGKVTDIFGINTFSVIVMRETLSPETFGKVNFAIKNGTKIDQIIADEVASAMKTWATARGATHYSHWFQPLTGGSAEKHDAFFDLTHDGEAIDKFKGSALVQQEPDASSFPSGGIRATFEARGYTAWDPTSPAFLIYNETGTATLCIPSVYVSYTGEILDTKTPLLKSLNSLDKHATSVAQIFDRNVEKVTSTVGLEQEYFLVDKALFNARPDLVMAGRTVFGHSPAKGQQLDDHYFGSIPPRVNTFMVEFEMEALKLGIPVRTRHNEVAPGQFEVAPTFEECNLACDHNILMMDLMKKVAERHKFVVLFHEKPFAGINGSGKHNNWSMSTDSGVNLLAPSSKPKENLRFITFLVNVIKAVNDNAELLGASVASAGNEYRLGSNEAPPAILSIFLGHQLSRVLDDLEHKEEIKIEKGENAYIKLGINRIPSILLDNTDRNRTSPFAFTGNKFEFRAVGGSANSAQTMTVLNTIVANQLSIFKEEYDTMMEVWEGKKEQVLVKLLKKVIKESRSILYEGNNYAPEWILEAKKRGLSNFNSTPKALEIFVKESAIRVFELQGVLTARELEARYEIELENYIKKIQIESRLIGDLAINHVVSTAIKYQTRLVQNAKAMIEIDLKVEAEPIIEIIKEISERISSIIKLVDLMTEKRKIANNLSIIKETAHIYGNEIKDFFEKIRYEVDKLELLIDDEDWPLVKYRELLYIK